MEVVEVLVKVAAVPLKRTLRTLLKPVPVIVTTVPTVPAKGETLVMAAPEVGVGVGPGVPPGVTVGAGVGVRTGVAVGTGVPAGVGVGSTSVRVALPSIKPGALAVMVTVLGASGVVSGTAETVKVAEVAPA